MTAGSDSFASGMFTRFDMTFLVAEPTRKGVSVYRQYKEYARDFGVALKVVGNKVQGRGRPRLPPRRGRGRPAGHRRALGLGARHGEGPPAPLRAAWRRPTACALRTLHEAADATYELRDWERYTRQMVHFHLKNASSWGNEQDRGRPGGAGRPRVRAQRGRRGQRPEGTPWPTRLRCSSVAATRRGSTAEPAPAPPASAWPPEPRDALRGRCRSGGQEALPALLRGLADLQGAQPAPGPPGPGRPASRRAAGRTRSARPSWCRRLDDLLDGAHVDAAVPGLEVVADDQRRAVAVVGAVEAREQAVTHLVAPVARAWPGRPGSWPRTG